MNKQLNNLLARPEFPRASQYDTQWVIENQTGLNPLWLTEMAIAWITTFYNLVLYWAARAYQAV